MSCLERNKVIYLSLYLFLSTINCIAHTHTHTITHTHTYTHAHTHTHTHPSVQIYNSARAAASHYPDDFRQQMQWNKKLWLEESRKLLLALRRALLTLHDVSDSDGVVFSDDEIDVQTALRRFRAFKEHLWDSPLSWDQITSRTGDRRTSWMEEWIDIQLQNIHCQLDILPAEFFFGKLLHTEYLWDRLRLDWFAHRTSMSHDDYVMANVSAFCVVLSPCSGSCPG